MVDTLQTQIRFLREQLLRERHLAQVVILAAIDLKAVAGDPSAFLLAAGNDLMKAIAAYDKEVPDG